MHTGRLSYPGSSPGPVQPPRPPGNSRACLCGLTLKSTCKNPARDSLHSGPIVKFAADQACNLNGIATLQQQAQTAGKMWAENIEACSDCTKSACPPCIQLPHQEVWQGSLLHLGGQPWALDCGKGCPAPALQRRVRCWPMHHPCWTSRLRTARVQQFNLEQVQLEAHNFGFDGN